MNLITNYSRGVIDEKLREVGGQIIERVPGKGLLVCDVDVLLPSSDVVAFGLSKEGHEELQAMTAYNEAFAGASEVETEIVLGGYEEA